MKNAAILMFSILLFYAAGGWTQTPVDSEAFTVARLKYGGGGDWYNDASMIPNLLDYFQRVTGARCAKQEGRVSLLDENLFIYPVLFMTGHGRIFFTDREAARLRQYLQSGGFLFADDDYGMDEHFRREMKKVFPDKALLAIPFSHPVFHSFYSFAKGLPKTHEHDGGSPEAWGYFHSGRLVVLYSYNANISDGWADPEVHKDPPEVREQALQMGVNILFYAMTQ
ncbi:DUF4159 domain-containing protein [bacterium]|nr:DUF4159 domain-containing protein [bacterium]